MGFLTLPHGFARGGIVACSIALVLLTLLNLAAAGWLIDTMARVTCLRQKRKKALAPLHGELFDFGPRLDLAHLCEELLGDHARRAVALLLLLLGFVVLWAYSSLVAASLAAFDPIPGACNVYHSDCGERYLVCLAAFGLLVLALSALGLEEQAHFQ